MVYWGGSGTLLADTQSLTQIAVEPRWYLSSGEYHRQSSMADLSVAIEPTLDWQAADSDAQIRMSALLRLGSGEQDRDHADVGELYWRRSWSSSHLLLGINKVFWGVAESVHLVDIVNQADFKEDIDGEQKLGQPMAMFTLEDDQASLSLFALFGFRPRAFPEEQGRFRVVGDARVEDDPEYEASGWERDVDFAARYSSYLGQWDWAVSLFDGTFREPLLVPTADGAVLVPRYQEVRQGGLELQYTEGPLLGKLEATYRDMAGRQRAAMVGGAEYTLFGVGDSAVDVGLLAEYVVDKRPPEWPRAVFPEGIFLGVRVLANDPADTTALLGIMRDPDSDEQMWSVEASARLASDVTLTLEGRGFSGVARESLLYGVRSDDYLQVGLNFFF